MDEAVEFIEQLGPTAPIARNVNLQLHLGNLKKEAIDNGIGGPVLLRLISKLAQLNDNVARKIVRSMIPSGNVPHEAVVNALGLMCSRETSTALQHLLLKWIVLVFDFVDSKENIHALYAVIFHFLQYETMCPLACHLLFLLTRKCDVLLFRVRALLELQNKLGSQPYLMGLLSIYKVYQPHLVALVIPGSKKSFFKNPDRIWSTEMRKVQEKNRELTDTELTIRTSALINEPSRKRRKLEVIPTDQGSCLRYKSISDVIENIDNIELPPQICSVLDKPYLQYAVMISPDPALSLRLTYWLDHVLYEEFFVQSPKNSPRAEKLLKCIIQFSEFLMEGVPICEHFLVRYLHTWSGEEYRDQILKLITKVRLHNFPALHDLILEPLRKLFICSDVIVKCQILVTLTNLLRNLCSTEWPRYQYTVDWQERRRQQHDSMSIHSDDPAGGSSPHLVSVFHEEVERFAAVESLVQLVRFVDDLSSHGLIAEENHPMLSHCVWDFFDVVSSSHTKYHLPFIELPSKSIVYPSLFASNVVALDRFCSCMLKYRESFERMGNRRGEVADMWPAEQEVLRQSLNQIHLLNSFILDGCDTLWRYRALISTEKNTIFRMFSQDEVDSIRQQYPGLHQTFSVHLHCALIGFVHRFCKTTKQDMNKVQPMQIKQYRDHFLKYINGNNICGIKNFLQFSIKKKHN